MFAGLFGSNTAKNNASIKASPQRRLSTTAVGQPPVIISRPPFPHPLPYSKIRVVCSADGLILSGLRSRDSSFSKRSILISYGKAAATSVLEDYDATLDSSAPTCTSYGCLGVLRLFQETYVLLITSKKIVGRYAGMPKKRIHSLTGVTAIPISKPALAKEAIQKHSLASARKAKNTSGQSSDTSQSSDASESSDMGSDSSSSAGDVTVNLSNSLETSRQDLKQHPDELDAVVSANLIPSSEKASPVKDDDIAHTTVQKAMKAENAANTGFGRFLWSYKNRPEPGETEELVDWAETASSPATPNSVGLEGAASAMAKDKAKAENLPPSNPKTDAEAESLKSLDKKILRELLVELSSGGFFFSQDFDLTTCLQSKWQALADELDKARNATGPKRLGSERHPSELKRHAHGMADVRTEEPRASEPLAHRADRRFWYNRWLSKDIVDCAAPEFATVLMQGYVQSRRISLQPAPEAETNSSMPAKDVSIPLQMLIISRRSVERPGLRYQRRGVNEAGGVANFVETEFIMSTHVEGKDHLTSYVQTRGSIPLYWSQSPWSLKPVPVLERDESDNLKALKKHFERQIKTYFGSVHIVNLAETSGKEGVLVGAYRDGVSKLDNPAVLYNEWDFHHMCKGMRYERIALLLEQLAPQIDHMASFWLMDRESLAKQRGVMRVNCMDCLDRTNVVESALARKHVITVLEHLGVHNLSSASQEVLDVAFNELWANNGDAVSREYAGTSALKGDFVRSGKRNWLGQFNDATNSVARYWQNTVLDFFKQAMIDYVLGINTNAFLEFSEKMQTTDPGEITRLANIRQSAVETAASAVLADEERKVYGWSLISPATFGQIRDSSFEEKILILSNKALYACSFEYTLQKVRDFIRIPLGQVVGIRQGEYILSALDPAARNVEENYGLCIRYLAGGVVERSRTYSIRNTASGSATSDGRLDAASHTEETREIAFKAVRKDLVRDLDQIASPTTVTSRVQVLDIVDHIKQACEEVGATTPEDEAFVEESPIISLAEAKAQVSLLDRLNYELKNMIWL